MNLQLLFTYYKCGYVSSFQENIAYGSVVIVGNMASGLRERDRGQIIIKK